MAVKIEMWAGRSSDARISAVAQEAGEERHDSRLYSNLMAGNTRHNSRHQRKVSYLRDSVELARSLHSKK